MRVAVKLFGPQAQLVGSRELTVDLQEGAATTAELRARLAQAEPRLAPSLESSRFAVNQVFVPEAAEISAGDEVALIGMLGGG